MRIGTSLSFELGAEAITRQQGELVKTQQQLSTGRRLVSPADDPVGASRSVDVLSSLARNEDHLANQAAARNSLALTEGTLGNVTDLLHDLRSVLTQAGNGVYNDANRTALATELRSRSEHLLGLANTQDADGRYIFAGFRDGVAPFAPSATGAVYQGDEGTRELAVADGRVMTIRVNGTVFDRVATGNGVFASAGDTGNAGTGVIDAGQVSDPALLDGHTYRLRFVVAGGVTSYDVLDTTAGATVSSGNAYTPGASISVAGMRVEVKGAPANGDSFTLAPSQKSSVFNMMSDAVALLETPVSSSARQAQFEMGLSRALANVDMAFDNVMLARTEAGAGLAELDHQQAAAGSRDLGYQQELSAIRDIDYAKAITDMVRGQTQLEASQKAFVQISGRSLFDLL